MCTALYCRFRPKDVSYSKLHSPSRHCKQTNYFFTCFLPVFKLLTLIYLILWKLHKKEPGRNNSRREFTEKLTDIYTLIYITVSRRK